MMLTIVPVDQKVNKDGLAYEGLDLSSCGIPDNVHALQWHENSGWIEYESPLVPNEDITVLPSWADACVAAWQTEYDKQHAAQSIDSLAIPDNIVV